MATTTTTTATESVKPSVRKRLRGIETVLNALYPERSDYIKGLVLAALSRQHVFVLGPPGTAKTELTQTFAAFFEGARFFDQLMMRTTAPEEVFGPNDIHEFREGRYCRVTKGSAVESDFVFLDEIWKGNSAVLNGALRMMSQREYVEAGRVYESPLVSLVGASNELPQEDNLCALYDRFALRFYTDHLQGEEALASVLWGERRKPSAKLNLTVEELDEATRIVASVEVPKDVQTLALKLKRELEQAGFACSVRRLSWVVSGTGPSLAKANAWLRGSRKVEARDLFILADVVWDEPEQRAKAREIVATLVSPEAATLSSDVDRLVEDYGLFSRMQYPTIQQAAPLAQRARELRLTAQSLVDDGVVQASPHIGRCERVERLVTEAVSGSEVL